MKIENFALFSQISPQINAKVENLEFSSIFFNISTSDFFNHKTEIDQICHKHCDTSQIQLKTIKLCLGGWTFSQYALMSVKEHNFFKKNRI